MKGAKARKLKTGSHNAMDLLGGETGLQKIKQMRGTPPPAIMSNKDL